MRALRIETIGLTRRFGAFVALDAVDLVVEPGTVHALLGENGAGKSTLVKCLVGWHRPDAGVVLVDDRETELASPQAARAAGIGMVYQHFTLVPSMTVAENLALAAGELTAVIDWRARREAMRAFLATTPFTVPLDTRVSALSAGERQKVEIVKQLYARNRLLILDEPTSVLTPGEAADLLGAVRALAHAGEITVLLITHKFHEVHRFADAVTVLRRGRRVGGGPVADFDDARLAALMVGDPATPAGIPGAGSGATPATGPEKRVPAHDREPDGTASAPTARPAAPAAPALSVRGLCVDDDRGRRVVDGLDLDVAPGEIVGIAGVSGNGQRELLESLVGQRERAGGTVSVHGESFDASRTAYARLRVGALPEEPLRNACVAGMTVAENLALRDFDRAPFAHRGWRLPEAARRRARAAIEAFGIRTRGPDEDVARLSGGNVQRCVLARELADDARLLIVMNPSFGLDFAAVADVHRRLRTARDRGCGVLMIGEDLDELIELVDRVVVMHAGAFAFSTRTPAGDRARIGRAMAGADLHPASVPDIAEALA